MNRRARGVFLRILILLAALIGAFVLFQEPSRVLETRAAAWILRSTGASVGGVIGTGVYLAPRGEAPFYAVVTPSCSALASALAIGCLATLVPASSRRRKAFAAGAAIVVVMVGNVLRIAASLGAGLVAGRGSLVLFHDSVGNLFSFAYTLGGYVLMLYLLLPADRPPAEPVDAAVTAEPALVTP